MRAGLRAVALVGGLVVCGVSGCGDGDDRVEWGRGNEPGGVTAGVTTVAPRPVRATGLSGALAHVRASSAARLAFEYGAALREPIGPRTDLTGYGYGRLGEIGRHLGAPLGFSVTDADQAFTAGRGATAAGGLVGTWSPGLIGGRLTALGATVTHAPGITRYALPRNAEFPIDPGPKDDPQPVTLPPVLRHIAVNGGLVAYGGNPGALADVTETHAGTLASASPFRELSACLGEVRAAIIVPGRVPYAAGTRVHGHRATNVLCALPGEDNDPAALANGIRTRAASFTVADGDNVRPLPGTTRIQVIRGPGHPVRVLVGDRRVNGDAFLRAASDGDLPTLIGT